MMIDDEIAAAAALVFSYASHIDDWATIKKEIVRIIPPRLRSSFSRRDELTKRLNMNEMERELIERWTALTGRPIIFKR